MNERIAVIDDSLDAAKTLAEYFQRYEVTVVIFTSCEELIESDEVFDAVVTDTNLGNGMTGFQCADKMHLRFPNATIVGTSVVEPEKNGEYSQVYQRSGANDFINRREGGDRIAQHVMDLLGKK